MDKTPRIHRTDKGPNSDTLYVRIDQRVINDMDLSPLARLAMVYILSKPDTWELRDHDLRQYLGKSGEPLGINQTRRIISELKRHGYIDRDQKKDKKTGEWKTTKTSVYETPELNEKSPLHGNRATGSEKSPLHGNRATGSEKSPLHGNRATGSTSGSPLHGYGATVPVATGTVARYPCSIVTNELVTNELVTNDKKGPEQIIFDSFSKLAQPELKMNFPGINWEFAKLSQRNSTLIISLPQLMLERLTPNLIKAQEIVKRNIEPKNITVEFVKDE